MSGGMKVLAFGEIVWDVYPEQACLGGAPLNFAAHCAKHGATVSMLSAVGDDSLGKAALAALAAWRVDTSTVTVSKTKDTGRCLVTLDEQSVPTYRLAEDTAWDAIDGGAVQEAWDVLYFGTLALRSAHNRQTLCRLLECGNGGDVFVDVNLRAPFYSAETVAFALSAATMVKISDEELPAVLAAVGIPVLNELKEVAASLCERYKNLRLVVITRGEQGAVAYERGGAWYTCPAVPTKAVSTVGAGDAFSAAFLCRYFDTGDVQSALEHAARVASTVVASYEAVPDYTV